MIHLRLTEAELRAAMHVCEGLHSMGAAFEPPEFFDAWLAFWEKLLDAAEEQTRGHDTVPIKD